MKKQAKDYELRNLINMKNVKSKTKMADLHYDKLNPQEYLYTIDVRLAKIVFKFRTRMMQFCGNFRGQGPLESCPLCGEHEDLQELCFKCPAIVKKFKVDHEYENIFCQFIDQNLAKTLCEIAKLRKKET